jgi:hypothetical protein
LSLQLVQNCDKQTNTYMKITKEHQTKYENLLTDQVRIMGFPTIREFIEHVRERTKAGVLRPPIKCEATLTFSYLNRGNVLRFICDVIYLYANDDHIATLNRALFAKHTA